MKTVLFICFLLLFGEASAVKVKKIFIPDLPEYRTLKADFHIHTSFSDGIVWPLVRIDEAVREGLDIIAITDHIDYQKLLRLVPRDHNKPYLITKDYARKNNILLVQGVEINNTYPPGHFNALFISDGNKIAKKQFPGTIIEAKHQGGFIVWNHPGLRSDSKVKCEWFKIQSWMVDHGLLDGIEIYNHNTYYPEAFDWALAKNLVLFSNTDNHIRMEDTYDLQTSHRPLTLVFARDRSVESVKEAVIAGRTASLVGDTVRGFENILLPLFHSCVRSMRVGEKVELINQSDLPLELDQVVPDKTSTIHLKERSAVTIISHEAIVLKVKNFQTAPGKSLMVKIE